MNKIIKYALINSFGTSLYVILVASFMSFYEKGFSGAEGTVLIPIVMLMLFVFSAGFTGSLVFCRPIMWYLDGKKREALSLLGYTLGIFLIVTLVAFILLVGRVV